MDPMAIRSMLSATAGQGLQAGGGIEAALAGMRNRLYGGGAYSNPGGGPGLPYLPQPAPGRDPQQQIQGSAVTMQDGQAGIIGRGGNFQPLGAAAQRQLDQRQGVDPAMQEMQNRFPGLTPEFLQRAREMAGMPIQIMPAEQFQAPGRMKPGGPAAPQSMDGGGLQAPTLGGAPGAAGPAAVGKPAFTGVGSEGVFQAPQPQPMSAPQRVDSARGAIRQNVRQAMRRKPGAEY